MSNDYGSTPTGCRTKALQMFLIPAALLVALLMSGLVFLYMSTTAPWSVTFHVINRSPTTIDSFMFTSPHGKDELGPIGVGASSEINVKTAFNFEYRYSVRTNGHVFEGVAAKWHDEDDEGYTKDQDIVIDTEGDGKIKSLYAEGRH